MVRKEQEWISIPMTVDVPFRFAAGRYMTKFMVEMRDHGRIHGCGARNAEGCSCRPGSSAPSAM